MRRSAASLVLGLAFACFARGEDAGLPVLRVIAQSEHRAGPQNFDVAQDRRGLLYFGNLRGVLTYDGEWWRVTALPNDAAVFSVESDSAGVIAVGAVRELGYLTAAHEYRSLLPQLPPAQRDVGDVRGVCTSGRGFVFATEHHAIEWNGGTPRILGELAPGTRCGRAGNSVMLWNATGLHRLERGRIVRAGFEGRQVDAAVETLDGRLLVAVRGEGLFLDHAKLDADASTMVTDMVALRDGGAAVLTREDGVLFLDAQGTPHERLGSEAGLPDNVLAAGLVDAEGALWLAYHGPVARIDLALPLTVYDQRRGVKGSPNHVLARGDRTFFSTSHGLFALSAQRAAMATRVAGIPPPAWEALDVDGALLVGTTDGAFLVRDGASPALIRGTETLAVYTMLRSRRDPSKIWLGTRKGLATLQQDGAAWRFGGLIAGTPGYLRSLLEHDGALWAGTVFNGVVRVGADGAVRQSGSGEMGVVLLGGRVVAAGNGALSNIDAAGRLVPDPRFGQIRVPGGFFTAVEDAQGNVWLSSEPPLVVPRTKDGYARETRPLPAVVGPVANITRDAQGAIWFAAHDGAFRYRPAAAPAQPLPLIRASAASAPLPHDFGRLRIEFAPASYGSGVMYQYRLDPVDETWSAWTREPFIDYMGLGGGDYAFRLRARGSTGAISEEARWSFSVKPPWYLEPLPIALALLVAAALVALIVKLRTRALRRQADRLRALVAERTQDLSEANQHLERLALLDPLTSIPNRRYFDRALARAFERAREKQVPVGLVVLDLDLFKEVNDAYGHAAGDAALIQICRLLGQRVRRSGEYTTRRSGEFTSRSGDVVARIGGEEFAILLVSTATEGAVRTAETLRTSIEALEIEFEGKTFRLTASCGVATIIPREDDTPEALVRRADAALYEAKAAGRNCVRVADPYEPRIRRENSGSLA